MKKVIGNNIDASGWRTKDTILGREEDDCK